jgi:crossover junction endodeoxyribonuclease RuvC
MAVRNLLLPFGEKSLFSFSLSLLQAKKHYPRLRAARKLMPSNMPSLSVHFVPAGRRLRVLGVDPAVSGSTGFGVIEIEGGKARPMRFGAWKFPARVTFAVRLREIHFLVGGLVEQFKPDAVAVESVFAALNVGTALKLAEVRGVVLLAAAQAHIPAQSYSPREVKSCVAGFGGASKEQVQRMVKSLLDLPTCPEPSDAADALAVALCHAQLSQARDRMMAAAGFRSVVLAGGKGSRSRISVPRTR